MNSGEGNIFGRRLRQARLIKGVSMDELGKLVTPSISRQAINKYEKGETNPDSRMLIAFCKALGVKPDYFFRPFSVTVDKIMFQKSCRISEKRLIAIRERVREELERYLEIEQLCGNESSFTLKKRLVGDDLEANEYAKEIRLELGLGLDGISNVIEVLEGNGVKIIEIDEAESFSGLSGLTDGGIPVIVINKKLSSENKRFTLLHEFAHILLDFDESIGAKTVEDICNAFAVELLLPSSVLRARVGTKRHDISLAELKDLQMQYGVSLDMIMTALRNLDIITDRRYVTYLKKKKTFPDFNACVEKSLSLPESSRRFVRMVYRALADDIISFSKAAALLNTSIEAVKTQFQLI